MLWHLCDISCHNIERICAAQVLFLMAAEPQQVAVGQAFLPVPFRKGRQEAQRMLASGKLVGFIPTKDYDKARAFYEGKLGFQFVSLDKFALVMNVGGHMIRIAKVPNFTPLQGTILGWQVENSESVAAWLRDRGAPPGKVSLRPGPNPRHLDHPGWQQSSVVQRSRRQHSLCEPACALNELAQPSPRLRTISQAFRSASARPVF